MKINGILSLLINLLPAFCIGTFTIRNLDTLYHFLAFLLLISHLASILFIRHLCKRHLLHL